MKKTDAMEKATDGPLAHKYKPDEYYGDGVLTDATHGQMVAIVCGTNYGYWREGLESNENCDNEAKHNGALLAHWMNHGPELLEALNDMLVAHGADLDTDTALGRISKAAIDAATAAEEVEGI